jgi:hypothetical protein
VKTRVNFDRFVVVEEAATDEPVLVDDVEDIKDEAFVFVQSVFWTALAGPH